MTDASTDDVWKVRLLLHGHDPADGHDGLATTDRAKVLTRILETSVDVDAGTTRRRRRSSRRRTGGLWLAPVGVLAVLVALVATQFGLPRGTVGSPAQAATPPSLAYQAEPGTAREVLHTLADRLRATHSGEDTQDGEAPPTTGYHYVRTQSWDLTTRIDGISVRSAVLPVTREVWRAGDGSGRVRTAPGEPQFPSEQARRAWEDEGHPRPSPGDETIAPGGLSAMYPTDLPADTAGLAVALAAGHPVENGPAETLVAVADLYLEQAPSAPVRAAVLDIVADIPQVYLLGRAVDRAGRPALAVAVDSAMSGLPTRYTLLFDPTDGRLLGEEKTLTSTAGALDVPIPGVISYTAFLDAAHTQNTEPPR
ncbi:CU044_5270 family protein [Frankia sp. R43]|uniref:CU044_5270 family protein n=1 Tax=Frankia sp. R43 TaxID=269536 RepID=UPI0006CA39F3|nr:CU044_5270 family protein [Frankia sp. R43]